ncbi:DNA-binding transcriptional regulator [Candidatus Nomurabacteria bacterium]|jgi:TrpR-related protein YerC/YecD|nr:MAG: DNA-binding transcriptional regulator [Candidatus Nomurabacteria bacterium]
MEFNWNIKPNTQLLEAIVSLENTDEAKRFLRDLMTEGEIEEFGKRLEAARLLSNNVQYNTIIKQTGLSSTTIARIAKWLRGSLGGYNLILTRIAHHHNSIQPRRGLS